MDRYFRVSFQAAQLLMAMAFSIPALFSIPDQCRSNFLIEPQGRKRNSSIGELERVVRQNIRTNSKNKKKMEVICWLDK